MYVYNPLFIIECLPALSRVTVSETVGLLNKLAEHAACVVEARGKHR